MDENKSPGPDKPEEASPSEIQPVANQQPESATPITPIVGAPASDPVVTTTTNTATSETTPPPHVPSSATSDSSHSAGIIVLQWLTYAFWGWTVLATSVLVGTVFANLISKSDTGGFMPYGIAAVLVLLPISIVCDVFYSKHEPVKKTGASSIVMVIHAVLFALFGIGALISAVISLILMFTSSSDSNGALTALLSSLVIFVLYAMTFVRTINPPRLTKVRRFYAIFMVAIIGVFAVLGIIGPMANAHRTKDDKLIENNLSSIQDQIDSYVIAEDTLPTSLDNLELQGDDAKLAKLVVYKPNTKQPKSSLSPTLDYSTGEAIIDSEPRTTSKIYYYQLCVTFKDKSSDYRLYGYDESSSYDEDKDGYSDYVSAYSHPAGQVCYKLSSDTANQ